MTATTAPTSEPLTGTRREAYDRFLENLDSGRTLRFAAASHKSTIGYRPVLNHRQYGNLLEGLGRMARASDRLAYVVRTITTRLNLYGTGPDLAAAVNTGAADAVSEPFYDVVRATGPEASRPSAHTHEWDRRSMIEVNLWVAEVLAGCNASVNESVAMYGWGLARAMDECGVVLDGRFKNLNA